MGLSFSLFIHFCLSVNFLVFFFFLFTRDRRRAGWACLKKTVRGREGARKRKLSLFKWCLKCNAGGASGA